ncbi:MAG TPA: hypothetical protein VMM38_01425 [Aridibacter sp.]|nr:hypothetical protein [Aridibacter sp.]
MKNLILVLGIGLLIVLGCETGSKVERHLMDSPGEPMLEYSAPVVERRSEDHMEVSGEVTNVSSHELRFVVEITLSGKDQKFLTSETTYPTYQPLAPGRSSSYKTLIRVPKEFEGWRVKFKTREGEQIPAEQWPRPEVKTKEKKPSK